MQIPGGLSWCVNGGQIGPQVQELTVYISNSQADPENPEIMCTLYEADLARRDEWFEENFNAAREGRAPVGADPGVSRTQTVKGWQAALDFFGDTDHARWLLRDAGWDGEL